MPPTHTRPPQLLVATHNHGAGLDLLALAERRGYTVRRAHTGAQALEQAHTAPPDLIALDESLTDMEAFAACRGLRDDPHVGPGIPVRAARPRRRRDRAGQPFGQVHRAGPIGAGRDHRELSRANPSDRVRATSRGA